MLKVVHEEKQAIEADGFRESSESWADLLRDCKRRGMRAPVLAVGDGAIGFWKALPEVFPTTREQRCWFHVSGNMLAALPKSAHPGARAALAEIYNRRGPASTPSRPRRRSRSSTARSSPKQVHVIDRVGAGDHPRDQARDLHLGVAAPGPVDFDEIGDEPMQPGPFGQLQHGG